MKIFNRWFLLNFLSISLLALSIRAAGDESFVASSKLSVSVVVLTTQKRVGFHPSIFRCFLYQSHKPTELIVVDDPGKPSPFFTSQKIRGDGRVSYFQTNSKLLVGAKRNLGIQRANGEVVVIFDDDDLYAPRYIERMVEAMHSQQVGFVKLASWHWYSTTAHALARWEPLESGCDSFIWGFGFSYVFERSLWQDNKYPALMVNEDYEFVRGLREQETGRSQLAALQTSRDSQEALVIHFIHGDNLSKVFSSTAIVKSELKLAALFSDQCAALDAPSRTVARRRRAACRRFYASRGATMLQHPPDFSKLNKFPTGAQMKNNIKACGEMLTSGRLAVERYMWVGASKGLSSEPPKEKPAIPRTLVFSSKVNLLEARAEERKLRGASPDEREAQIKLKLLRHTLSLHPGWDIRYYTDAECLRLLEEDLNPPVKGIVSVFNSLKKGAYKADICRLAALYLHGGVYLDISMPSHMAVEEWLQPHVTFASALSVCPAKGDFFQSILASVPGHPALRLAMEMITREFVPGHRSEDVSKSGFPRHSNYYSWPRFDSVPEKSFCDFKLGSVFTFLAWEQFQNAAQVAPDFARGHATQLLHETPQFFGFFDDVRGRDVHLGQDAAAIWTMCKMLVVDPYSMKVTFCSQSVEES